MFSFKYLWNSLRITARHPTAALSAIEGRDAGAELQRVRVARWKTIGHENPEAPMKTFGFRIFLNPDDMSSASASIGVDGVYLLPISCLFFKILKKGMSFVDVGAYLGYFTILAAKIVGQSGSVTAFEPDTKNLQLMTKSLALNGGEWVKVNKLALGDHVGKTPLYHSSSSEPNFNSVVHDLGHGFEETSQTTLDEYWRQTGSPNWDLIKIHVSGDEQVVLRGSLEVIGKVRPMISMIFNPRKWKSDDGLLESLFDSYEVNRLVESPFLLKKIDFESLSRREPTLLFLTPVDGARRGALAR